MADEPKKHHFVPIFYLKSWAGSDDRLCQFSKPYKDIVKPKRVHPAGTGYLDRLYELRGLKEEVAQTIEREFMTPVDDKAAVILQEFLQERHAQYGAAQRSAWTRFLFSLLMRSPEDLARFKVHYFDAWMRITPEREKAYQLKRKKSPTLPAKLEEALRLFGPEQVERSTLRALPYLIDNAGGGEHVIRMKWGRIKFPFHSPALLTSDRPIIMSNGIRGEDGHIILPISPKHAFYAVNSQKMESYLRFEDPGELANRINEIVVTQAVRYVYGQHDVHLPYVQNYMGKRQRPSFFDTMHQQQVTPAKRREMKRALIE